MVNGELLFLSAEEKVNFIAQITIGRGVLSKKRLPLEKRIKQLGSFTNHKPFTLAARMFIDKAFKDIARGSVSFPGCESCMPEESRTPVKRRLFSDDSEEGTIKRLRSRK